MVLHVAWLRFNLTSSPRPAGACRKRRQPVRATTKVRNFVAKVRNYVDTNVDAIRRFSRYRAWHHLRGGSCVGKKVTHFRGRRQARGSGGPGAAFGPAFPDAGARESRRAMFGPQLFGVGRTSPCCPDFKKVRRSILPAPLCCVRGGPLPSARHSVVGVCTRCRPSRGPLETTNDKCSHSGSQSFVLAKRRHI